MNDIAKETLEVYAKLFLPTENKYSLLFQKRLFAKLEEILKALIYLFDEEFNKEKQNDFYCHIADYQKLYFDKLVSSVYKYEDAKKGRTPQDKNLVSILNKYISQKDTIFRNGIDLDRLDVFHKLLLKMDKTAPNLKNSFSKLSSNGKEESEDKQIETIEENFKNFYEAYKLYEKTVNYILETKNNDENNLHSANPFINEFHQFLSHYSYYFLAKINQSNNEEFKHYIYQNLRKAIGHLERSILDIYKVIVVIFDKNGLLTKNEYLRLIEIRQSEIEQISLPIEDRLKDYKKFVLEINNKCLVK